MPYLGDCYKPLRCFKFRAFAKQIKFDIIMNKNDLKEKREMLQNKIDILKNTLNNMDDDDIEDCREIQSKIYEYEDHLKLINYTLKNKKFKPRKIN